MLQKAKSNQWLGKILKSSNINELWYVSSINGKRKRITMVNAHIYFKKLIISIEEKDLLMFWNKENSKNISTRRKFKGKFIKIKDDISQLWYIDDQLIKHTVSHFDFLDFLSNYAVNITPEELGNIPQ